MRISSRAATVALALALGCEAQGRSDVVPLLFLKARPQHSPDVLEGASEALGMELSPEAYAAPHGAVVLFSAPAMPPYSGETEIVHICAPVSWSIDEPLALAHEIGHALWLQHADDPANLMYPYDRGTELTDAQIDTMRHAAWYLQHECRTP
jgi:hypothetical protein